MVRARGSLLLLAGLLALGALVLAACGSGGAGTSTDQAADRLERAEKRNAAERAEDEVREAAERRQRARAERRAEKRREARAERQREARAERAAERRREERRQREEAELAEAEEEAEEATAACHPSYEGACLDPSASDYDCAGGSGDGPLYTGTVYVVGPDDFDLDRDGDGVACEA